jgi:hypothetical protein
LGTAQNADRMTNPTKTGTGTEKLGSMKEVGPGLFK